MGDHRMNIKIEIEFHKVKQKTDMWINYMPDTSDYDRVDRRIVEFIQESYETGMRVYERENIERMEIEHADEIESEERAELKRLQDKYNTPHKDTT